MIKKKVLIIFICVVSLVSFSSLTYAKSDGEVYLTSKMQEVEKGEELEIIVNLENNKTAACNFDIYFDTSKVSFISNMENTNLISDRISYVWFDTLGGEGAKKGEIERFKFRAKENGVATFTIEGEFYNEKGQMIETTFKETKVQIGKVENSLEEDRQEVKDEVSKNTNLEVLAIENILLNPPFEASNTDYTIEVPYQTEELNIFAVPEDEEAEVQIIGQEGLKGNSKATIQVKVKNGYAEKIYTINVNKRTKEEEKQFEEEQAKQKERLEEAYKIEKTSTKVNIDNEQFSNKRDTERQNHIKWTMLVAGVITAMFV